MIGTNLGTGAQVLKFKSLRLEKESKTLSTTMAITRLLWKFLWNF